ncbi:hypothetical protein [Caulobacter endophyticus]|uniref:Uncharacterized protein n=1 Tax=Caulobacter endophyticus TaxID=2172652 RepID=A0A2T9JEF4_9CAUL|nr:hypothetical protein [Caulobacter endophyticus]PVM82074.1 hypothetical protein DDF67_23985 [Caulobacter endophyticus]
MTFNALLTQYLDAARQAADQLERPLDPLSQLRRIAWALAEIEAKTILTPPIMRALADTRSALDEAVRRVNSVLLILEGMASAQALLRVRIDALARALRSADPDPTTAFLHGL